MHPGRPQAPAIGPPTGVSLLTPMHPLMHASPRVGDVNIAYALPWRNPDRGTLAHRAAAEAARRIVEGDLPAGELLRENDLAEATGISRTPAREAMLQLERWGLVRLLPKKGALVTTVTPRERRELIAVRTMLEASAGAALLSRPDAIPALAEELAELLSQQRAAATAQDPLAFAAADLDFHLALIAAADNSVVAGICEDLGPRFACLTAAVLDERSGTMPALLAEHEELAALLAAGDPAAFAERLRAHVEDAYELDGGAR